MDMGVIVYRGRGRRVMWPSTRLGTRRLTVFNSSFPNLGFFLLPLFALIVFVSSILVSFFTRAYFDLALHVGVPMRILHELCRVRI